jgi:hypothetical protein
MPRRAANFLPAVSAFLAGVDFLGVGNVLMVNAAPVSDLPEAGFWLTSVLPTSHPESLNPLRRGRPQSGLPQPGYFPVI